MDASYTDLLHFVQYFVPTWRKTQHTVLAQVVTALLARPSLRLSELARGMPSPRQPLHGRLKRLTRFLDNPRLDEAALPIRWLKLAYRFGDDAPHQDTKPLLLPLLFDTTYFEPFATLIASVPCGSRGLPVALTTYHRTDLRACFPPENTWPNLVENPCPPAPCRDHRTISAASVPTTFPSQNQIEEHLIDYVFALLSPALRGVVVADRGFARASLFRDLLAAGRDFDIRIDAQTHIQLPAPLAPGRPAQGEPATVLGLKPGQHIWCPQAWYGKADHVPIKLLARWDVGYKEPWYLATSLDRPDHTEILYRWRMRLECTNRDEKSGVLLRESGDTHALRNVLHVHRLMLALALADWVCALTGLQAWRDLPAVESAPAAILSSPNSLLEAASPSTSDPALPEGVMPRTVESAEESEVRGTYTPDTGTVKLSVAGPATPLPSLAACDPPCDQEFEDDGPSSPPPVVPHRGETPKLPDWMRRFAARGHLSYVRLGLEVLRVPDLRYVLRNLVRWLGDYLRFCTPLWRPYQIRYRLRHWWADSS